MSNSQPLRLTSGSPLTNPLQIESSALIPVFLVAGFSNFDEQINISGGHLSRASAQLPSGHLYSTLPGQRQRPPATQNGSDGKGSWFLLAQAGFIRLIEI